MVFQISMVVLQGWGVFGGCLSVHGGWVHLSWVYVHSGISETYIV